MFKKLAGLVCALAMISAMPVYANEMALYSVNTGSFVYHLTGNHGQYNEKFNNQFFPLNASCLRIQSIVCWSGP
jgi:hypothetical protein